MRSTSTGLDGDIPTQAGGHASGVHTAHTSAEHNHLTRKYSRHAAEQNAATSVMFGEIIAAHNDRHPTGDLAHGLEQRKAAIHLHRLIGNGSTTRLHQCLCKIGIGSEV
jgi:hypothetical protein